MNRMISMVIRIFIAQVMRRGISRGLGGMTGGGRRGGGGRRQRLDNRPQQRAKQNAENSKAPPAGRVSDAPPPQPRPRSDGPDDAPPSDSGNRDTDQ